MSQTLRQIRELIRQKDYEAALEKVLWFHDHALEEDSSLYGVRLSFAMTDWKILAEQYPPAHLAMLSTRDQKTALLRTGQGPPDLFHDVVTLNQYLKEPACSLELFEFLDQAFPELAQHCWIFIREQVLEAQKYALARHYIPDFWAAFETFQTDYLEQMEIEKELPPDVPLIPQHREIFQKFFAEEIVLLIKWAWAEQDGETARQLQAEALKILDHPELRNALPEEAFPNQ